MQINNQLHIEGKKVLVVGFWGYQNMGDELILLGTLKLLLAQGKEIFVVSANNERLKEFFGQFIDISPITFVDELPRGFRSLWAYLLKKRWKQLKYFFQVDAVILGG
jgi:polysaccharide pyruvyl transferase WcaK-like protein